MNIGLIGGGSWGTAIARLLYNKGHKVFFYIRNEQVRNDINDFGENKKYLPNISVGKLKATGDISYVIDNSEIIVLAVPTQNIRKVVEENLNQLNGKTIVNLSKGLELNTLYRVSEICNEILPDSKFVAISGPSHAEEVGRDIPTAIVASSTDMESAKLVQEVFSTDFFRVYTNDDLIGVEIGASLKNIIALAAGMCDGLGYGDNTIAALATRGIYEMSKLGKCLGAKPQTFNGLSGIGDLIVTCTSMHSRNRRAGVLIGKGKTPEEAFNEIGQVVEGIKTTKSAYELAKKNNVVMPITDSLYEVIYNNKSPKQAVMELMRRDYKQEIDESMFE